MAMALYPQVQKRAQDELDTVVGRNKLPTFEHKDDLPYVKCILLEVLRWHPVAPMGVPHLTTADILYEGWIIPAGTSDN